MSHFNSDFGGRNLIIFWKAIKTRTPREEWKFSPLLQPIRVMKYELLPYLLPCFAVDSNSKVH